MTIRLPLLAVALLLPVLLGPTASRAWQTAVSGTPPASRPLAVTVDAAGDVVAAGRAVAETGGDDAIVAKLSGADGSELWRRISSGSAGGTDQLRSIATDTSNGVVAAGQSINVATRGDVLVVKYDAGGNASWRLDLDGGADGADDALAVALDAADDVIVTGEATPDGGIAPRFTVIKRSGVGGGPVWRTDLVGTPGMGRAVVVAGTDVVAAGDVSGRIVVVKLAAASGVETWRTDVAGSPSAGDIGRALAVGGGRAVVAGHMVTAGGGDDFAVVALDAATGAELWRYVVDGTAADPADADDAFGVAVDAAGDVIAVGRVSAAVTDDDLVVVKLAGATGTELWRTTVNGGNDNDAQAVVLDAAGDALVVGSIRNPGRGRDIFVGKFAGATGAELWRREIDGTESAADVGMAVAMSITGDLVAAGRLRNGDVADGFTVVKRTGANGGDFPCADGTSDPGEACDDGNVAAGDGCRADCTAEVCGDGILDPQEQCDDGATLGGDCCAAACTFELDGGACDDGDACTLDEMCQAGRCVPSDAIICVPESPCHDAVCDAARGTCSSTRKANGALCDDADACTVLDRCIANVCTGTIAPRCEDEDACTLDGCDPAIGCVSQPRTGFGWVTCVLERGTIATACGTGVPRPISTLIDRASRLLDRGATGDRPRRVQRALVRAVRTMKRGLRVTDKQRKRLTPDCADGILTTLKEVVTRAKGLQVELRSNAAGR